jgi:putative intracellular protease/amidase
MPAFDILFPLYPGVTQLDFTGPHQVFSRLPGARVTVASAGGREVEADGLVFSRLANLAEVERTDLLCVPGGLGAAAAMLDEAFIGEIRRLATGARYVSSVCTGSLILAAAGLLAGRRAATHWAWRGLLAPFGANVATERVVRDGHLFTGGGVTAGIDLALAVAAELVGAGEAQAVQLALEYAPAPPFDCGRPETAPAEVRARVERSLRERAAARLSAAQEAARRLDPVAAGA